MEAGPANNLKIGAIIQARMSSARLPGKILMPLPFPSGKPLLKWITDNLKQSKYCKEIYIASSKEKANDAVEEFAKEEKVSVFRGSENDVLSRFQHIIERSNLDIVVRLTGDNPFIDVTLLDQTIEHHINLKNHYTKTTGLPLGMNLEVVNGNLLLDIGNDCTDEEKEHVTLYARNSDKIKKGDFQPLNLDIDEVRLTIDYPVDFLVASQLALLIDKNFTSIQEIYSIYQRFPWLFTINKNSFQKKQFKKTQDELLEAYEILERLDLKRSAEIIKKHILTTKVEK